MTRENNHGEERRTSAPILLPAGKKWRAIVAFAGFGGLCSVCLLLVQIGVTKERFEALQRTQVALQQTQIQIRQSQADEARRDQRMELRFAVMLSAENETRRVIGLPPVDMSSVAVEATVVALPRMPQADH